MWLITQEHIRGGQVRVETAGWQSQALGTALWRSSQAPRTVPGLAPPLKTGIRPGGSRFPLCHRLQCSCHPSPWPMKINSQGCHTALVKREGSLRWEQRVKRQQQQQQKKPYTTKQILCPGWKEMECFIFLFLEVDCREQRAGGPSRVGSCPEPHSFQSHTL